MLNEIISKHNLNEKQSKFLNLANQKKNIFLFGKAGTGKSHAVKALKEFMGVKLAITASTGIAALNINGVTLHSYIGVGKMLSPIDYTIKQIFKNQELFEKIQRIQCILIDEISMFSNKPFIYLDAVLRKVKNDNRVCGGVQIIAVGDYMQLPYVDNVKQNQFDKSGIFQSPAYKSEIWQNLDFQPVCLNEIMRQKGDNTFIEDLNYARNGLYSPSLYANREKRALSQEKYDKSNLDHIIITSENATVNKINEFKYNQIGGKEFTYLAHVIKGDRNAEYACGQFERVKPEIRLKIGTQVIVEQNINIDKGLVNGTKGVIVDFNNEMPLMKYGKDELHCFEPYDFKIRHYSESLKKNEEVLHLKQLPLSLSYAITVNRSQGLTFDNVIVNIGNEGLFHKGKIYTAISRCKSYNGLLFMNFPNRKKNNNGYHFEIDSEAKEFLEEQEQLCNSNSL